MKKHILILSALFFSVIICAQDGTLKISAGSSLKVFPTTSLTVKDKITNLGDGTNFIIQSDANLIQINNTNTNSGNLISERVFNINADRKQYNYVGSPVAFASGESYKTIFPGSTNTPVLYHNQTTNTFITSSGANIPGRGSAVKEPPTSTVLVNQKTTAQFKGVPQNGDIILQITNRDVTPGSTTYGYNLMGNPYASNIDLIKLYALNGGNTNNNISSTFYLWDNNVNTIYTQQGSGYQGQAYALYNVITGNNGTGTAAAGSLDGSNKGLKKPTNILKVGQGFMTKSLKASYSFKFDNTIRTTGTSAVDFLGKNRSLMEDDRYWLKMIAPSGITSTIAIVHYFGGNYLFGPEDSRSMGGSDALYSIVEAEKLAINGRENFQDTDRIPLGSEHFENGNYTIGIDAVEGIFAHGQSIYLKDMQSGITTDLSKADYTFFANAGESIGRFEITYRPEAVLSTSTAVKEELLIYKDQGDFVIQAQTTKISSVEVYDTGGRLIYSVKPNNTRTVIGAERLINNVYILKINQKGVITTRKIIK